MPQIVIVEDTYDDGHAAREALKQALECDGSDIDLWIVTTDNVPGSPTRAVIKDHAAFFKMGLEQALEEAATTDASLLICDLGLALGASSGVVKYALRHPYARDPVLAKFCTHEPLNTTLTGLLVIFSFLKEDQNGGRQALAWSTFLVPAVQNVFERFEKPYHRLPKEAPLSDLCNVVRTILYPPPPPPPPEAKPADWNCETWGRLRHATWKYAGDMATAEPTLLRHPAWAHHLPFGGSPEAFPQSDLDRWMEGLRQTVQTTVGAKYDGPDFQWNSNSVSEPPLRAVMQFDNWANDLTTLLYLLKEETRKLEYVDVVTLQISSTAKGGRLEHDYLWFNSSALVEGLSKLARCFNDIARETRNLEPKAQYPVPSRFGPPETEIQWDVREIIGENQKQLRIRVFQLIRATSAGSELKSLWKAVCTFPLIPNATAKAAEAYDSLRNAGASLSVEDGILHIVFNAEEQSFKMGEEQPRSWWLVCKNSLKPCSEEPMPGAYMTIGV